MMDRDQVSRAWQMLCERLNRDPSQQEETNTLSMRAAYKAMVAFANQEAADAISRLEREKAELVEALEGMLTGLGPDGYALPCGAVHTSRASALLSRTQEQTA